LKRPGPRTSSVITKSRIIALLNCLGIFSAKAEILIQEAVYLAKEVFGTTHPKYADCLVDYGFYLLNVDSIRKSLQAYQSALEVRSKTYCKE
jgi:hypothetical protein